MGLPPVQRARRGEQREVRRRGCMGDKTCSGYQLTSIWSSMLCMFQLTVFLHLSSLPFLWSSLSQ